VFKFKWRIPSVFLIIILILVLKGESFVIGINFENVQFKQQ
jgi:hypothetical protein